LGGDVHRVPDSVLDHLADPELDGRVLVLGYYGVTGGVRL